MEQENGASQETQAPEASNEVSERAESSGGAVQVQDEAGNDGSSGKGESGNGEGAKETAPFLPNFKFRVKDKEHEFDDFIKPVVKSKEIESKLKDFYEKAYGIDEVKSSRDSVKKQFEEIQGKYSEVEKSLQTLGEFVKKDDFRSFFSALSIPKEKIIQYAIDELKYQEMPLEQRQQIDSQRRQQTEFETAQRQNQELQTQMQNMVMRQTEFELSNELAKPDVASIISSFDARVGQVGAFKDEVIKRGRFYESVHKVSPPASQLVAEVLTLIGQPKAQAPATQSQVVHAQQEKPVIANFQGGAKSPVKKVPSSIDELRKMRQQLNDE